MRAQQCGKRAMRRFTATRERSSGSRSSELALDFGLGATTGWCGEQSSKHPTGGAGAEWPQPRHRHPAGQRAALPHRTGVAVPPPPAPARPSSHTRAHTRHGSAAESRHGASTRTGARRVDSHRRRPADTHRRATLPPNAGRCAQPRVPPALPIAAARGGGQGRSRERVTASHGGRGARAGAPAEHPDAPAPHTTRHVHCNEDNYL